MQGITSGFSSRAQQERLLLVDALRGFALLGLFLVHCLEYFDLYWIDPTPTPLHKVVFFLFAGKAYAVFATLFGLSFFIIMDRRGIDFAGRFLWRLLLLLMLGTLHSLIYMGDILQILALIGLGLLLANRLSNKILVVLAALCIAQLPGIYQSLAALANSPGANDMPRHWAMYGEAFEVMKDGSLGQLLAHNAWKGMLTKWMFFIESGRGIQLAGLFMIGLLLGRTGFFADPDRYARQRRLALGWSLAISLVLLVLQQYLQQLPEDAFQGRGMAGYYIGQTLDSYVSTALTALGILVFVHLYRKNLPRRLLNLLAPCGRMSLSIYLIQALICVPLFYPFGLGWYQGIGQGGALLMGLAIFAALTTFAHLWMDRFHYGPAEWIWRAGTLTTVKVPFLRQQYAREAIG
ncbi:MULTISPECIES: DUF418 domain-containing protein [unclassified Microbulbifer]|uniref:DUF418 domain-containing protein n=1 Tax=unclassified Microbulbifer TaxID=2619833 RepID=UPI0027E47212|nr:MULTISPECIES: DUF418 domain-containing protein [unclassified Microbulbifer]